MRVLNKPTQLWRKVIDFYAVKSEEQRRNRLIIGLLVEGVLIALYVWFFLT